MDPYSWSSNISSVFFELYSWILMVEEEEEIMELYSWMNGCRGGGRGGEGAELMLQLPLFPLSPLAPSLKDGDRDKIH